MSFFDNAKELVGQHKKETDQAVDEAAALLENQVPDHHDAKVAQAANKAKDAINKLT